MAKFYKTETSFGYQIEVTGDIDNRYALITKMSDQNVWYMSQFKDGELFKSSDFLGAFKRLSDVKFSAECWVD